MTLELRKAELISLLKGAVGAAVVSISLVSQIAEIHTNISSPTRLAAAFEQRVDFLDEGPYLVSVEPAGEDGDEFSHSAFAMAITLRVELAKKPGKMIGGYDSLLRALSDYEYLVKVSNEPYGLLGHVLVLLPQEPNEIETLKQILAAHSVVYSLPDGTGTLNVGNVFMGNGLRA